MGDPQRDLRADILDGLDSLGLDDIDALVQAVRLVVESHRRVLSGLAVCSPCGEPYPCKMLRSIGATLGLGNQGG